MAWFRKVKAGLVKDDIDQFVGEEGNIFFNVENGEFRLSDGVTPGGIPLGSGGGGYVLLPATSIRLGGVRIGANINVLPDGTISVAAPFSGNYSDLAGQPTALSDFSNDLGYLTTVDWNIVQNKPTFSVVATSGSYNDLLNLPTLSTVATSGSYNDLVDKPTPEEEMAFAKRIDFVEGVGSDPDIIYRGEAAPGTVESAAAWRIRRLTVFDDDDVREEWADGEATYTKVWNDRLTLSYS